MFVAQQGCNAMDFNGVLLSGSISLSDVLFCGWVQVWWQHSTAAARSSAAAAGEKMRETMAGSLAAMKNLNLGFSRNPRDNAGP